VMSGVYASMWGTPKLNPGLVGLLFMTEISVGAITAALWSGDPFGRREAIGIILISGAGMMESLWELWRRRAAAQIT
jgi:drug/metabolite transporter (DMT)-like permease